MRDSKPLSRPSTPTRAEGNPTERIEAALLQLAGLLGRRAARDWLSAEACLPETADDA